MTRNNYNPINESPIQDNKRHPLTSKREDLSYSSMFSESYNTGIKDKDATIAILHELVKAVKIIRKMLNKDDH